MVWVVGAISSEVDPTKINPWRRNNYKLLYLHFTTAGTRYIGRDGRESFFDKLALAFNQLINIQQYLKTYAY